MNDVVWLTMRRLRAPLILLIITHFVSASILVLVPGVDPAGDVYHLDFLHAIYFVAFMATTIGFGEVPYEFTGVQRMVVLTLIYPNVIAWLYAIGKILSLFLDPQFQKILNRHRFIRRVRRMNKPFYILSGLGHTGTLLGSGLLNRGYQVVVLDGDEDNLHRKRLREPFSQVPMLACDVSRRQVLEIAGIDHSFCCGVIAVTPDDHTNLTIAITSKLLQPDLTVYARSQSQRVSDNMASFGTDQVIDPYDIFARRLLLAITAPMKYLVQDWLISVPGSELRSPMEPPVDGHWIVCGAGRFGSRMIETLESCAIQCTVVDVHPDRVMKRAGSVLGRGTEAETLREAGIEKAVALIAGTGDDIDNLSIILTAKELNPKLFLVARQEDADNETLFDRTGADLVAKPSLILARRILALATTPLLRSFLDHMEHEDRAFAERLKHELEHCLGGRAPSLWLTEIEGEQARGIQVIYQEGVELQLDHLLHNTRSGNDEVLQCVCLVLERGAQRMFLPPSDRVLMEGDRLLFAGRSSARREIERALSDPMLLFDYATPQSQARTALGRWWLERQRQKVSED